MTYHDPSWCARLHARPSPPPEPVPAAPAGPTRFFEKREIPSVHECELCGTVMYDHNCKIVCPNCGYKRDCSDP
jgi:ribosomal protein L37E